jgi:tryptophan synthase beta chain
MPSPITETAPGAAIDYSRYPDASGHFGRHGGRFVAETLIGPLEELAAAYDAARVDPAFIAAFEKDLKHYVGRPSPIYHAERLSRENGGAQILLKREDLNHTGAHKINNTIGQALLASRMGKTRIIAETGAGQHGVASATVATRLGLECVVYMGATDIERQKINVYRMKLLGATVVPVTSGSATLKDALNEAMRDWVTNVQDTFYIIGTVAGPDPYPRMVRDFNAVVGREARAQMLSEYGRLPDALTACVGGGSNAIGLFHAFLNDGGVRIVGAEAAGDGIETGRMPPRCRRAAGVLHGNRTYVFCDDDGQIIETHSISAGLDYPGVGPRARVPEGQRPRRVRRRHRRRGAGRLPQAHPHRGHPAGAGIQPCDRPGAQACARVAEGRAGPVQPVRSRRQGRAHHRGA